MSAVDNAKRSLRSALKAAKLAVTNTSEFFQRLTLYQAIAVAVGALLIWTLLTNFLVKTWQKNAPGLFLAFIKFIIYVMIPLIAVASAIFGMWLEHKYEKFADFRDFVLDKFEKASSGAKKAKRQVDDIRKEM